MNDNANQSVSSKVTLTTLFRHKQLGEKFACLTAYDATFASVLEKSGVELILVGDSLGMVIQGRDTTLPVTMSDMIYHTQCVARGLSNSMIMADMPFMSEVTPLLAFENAGKLLKEGGAHIVKIEGGAEILDTINFLSVKGIPVCAHIGLLPQSVNKLGGYKVQGRDKAGSDRLLAEAKSMEKAGADLILMECVPAELADKVVRSIKIPVIGIGAGNGCDGQVLVLQDLLGISSGSPAKFVRNFLKGRDSVFDAISDYVKEVKSGAFPEKIHSFK